MEDGLGKMEDQSGRANAGIEMLENGSGKNLGKEGWQAVPCNNNESITNKLTIMQNNQPFTQQEAAKGANADTPNTGPFGFLKDRQ